MPRTHRWVGVWFGLVGAEYSVVPDISVSDIGGADISGISTPRATLWGSEIVSWLVMLRFCIRR